MAPEQLLKAEYGVEVDWWALGALVWEMCTGENTFYHSNRKVREMNAESGVEVREGNERKAEALLPLQPQGERDECGEWEWVWEMG